MKHLIAYIFGLLPVLFLAGLGVLFYFQLWIPLIVALALAPYPVGLLLGRVYFPPEK